ncbi:DUF4145 domain-containing protein [Allorhizobium undicola]|uniref:DUF4145 domain-containing protein n=1 Tax=Allorhizobium undicola TaxID=78527 RepID=UPI002E80570B|nr:DUF4145 domain-containing protein [Allorhizobium undicola]
MCVLADIWIRDRDNDKKLCVRTRFNAACTLTEPAILRIDALVERGMMSVADKDAVQAMTDAGNASAHRGYEPSFEQLMHIVDVVAGFIKRQFYYHEIAQSLLLATPAGQGESDSRYGR